MLTIETLGAGPPLVLVHGSPQPPTSLRPFAERLASGAEVHLVHLPGWEGSARIDAGLLQASRLIAEQLGALGPATWVGVGLGFWRVLDVLAGGRVAIPRRVVGLGPVLDFTPAERAATVAAARSLLAGEPGGETLVSRLLSPAFAATHPEVAARVGAYASGPHREVAAHELLQVGELPGRAEAFLACRAPRLVRVGELDTLACGPRLEVLCARAGVTLQVVPGAGHLLDCEDGEATARAALG